MINSKAIETAKRYFRIILKISKIKRTKLLTSMQVPTLVLLVYKKCTTINVLVLKLQGRTFFILIFQINIFNKLLSVFINGYHRNHKPKLLLLLDTIHNYCCLVEFLADVLSTSAVDINKVVPLIMPTAVVD